MRVKVTGAPGFEDFEGTTTPELHNWMGADGIPRSVVKCDGEWHVLFSHYVEVL